MKIVAILIAFATFLLSTTFIKTNSIHSDLDQIFNDPEYLSLTEYQQIKILKAIYHSLDESYNIMTINSSNKPTPSPTKFKKRPKNIFVG